MPAGANESHDRLWASEKREKQHESSLDRDKTYENGEAYERGDSGAGGIG